MKFKQEYYNSLRDKLVSLRGVYVESFEKILGKHRRFVIEEYNVTNQEGEPVLNGKGENIIQYTPTILWVTEECIELDVCFYEDEMIFFINDYRLSETESETYRIFSECTIDDCLQIAQDFVDNKIKLDGKDTPYNKMESA